ncbi:hypothetical protein JOQ06_020118, partial [Pogonophryne albipinna]
GPSVWELGDTQVPGELLELFQVDQESTRTLRPSIAPSNMSFGEHQALEELQGNMGSVVAGADAALRSGLVPSASPTPSFLFGSPGEKGNEGG